VTEEALIDAIFDREGRVYAAPPAIDQPTAPGGIILPTLAAYLQRPATLAELRALTVVTARPIVRWVLQQLATAHGFDRIADEALRMQLIDFAYNSGPALAIRWLQRVLGVPRTGLLDAATVTAIHAPPAGQIPVLLNQALVAARLEMLHRAVASGTIARKFDDGLETRMLAFSQLVVP
jgi:lysozyme family protein